MSLFFRLWEVTIWAQQAEQINHLTVLLHAKSWIGGISKLLKNSRQEKIDVLSTRNQELEFLFELKNSENEQLKRDRDQTEDRRCWLIIDNEELKGKLDKATKGRASGKKSGVMKKQPF